MSIADRIKKREGNEKKRKVSLTILLVAAGVVIVGVTAVLLIILNTKKIDGGIYFYDTGVKFEKQGAVIKNDEENGVYLESSGNKGTEKLALSSAPLYYADQQKIFVPTDCTINIPSERKAARIATFTEFENRQGSLFALAGNAEYGINEGFLYDGKSTYIFLDDMTVSWNGEAIDMPALSYAVVVYNQRIELYPYGGDPIVAQTGMTNVTAHADKGYSIDLGACILTNAEGFESLLISEPSLMEPFTGE